MTLTSDLEASLHDETFHDVELIGNDSPIPVPATKFVLAARSPVFKKMFFGDFAETTRRQVKLDFSRNLLDILVEYCYTDEVDYVVKVFVDEGMVTDRNKRNLVRLRFAADYFELREMEEHLTNEMCSIMAQVHPCSVCTFLDESLKLGGPEAAYQNDPALWQVAKLVLEKYTEEVLLPRPEKGNPDRPKGIVLCDEVLLQKLLAIVQDPYYKVKALQAWNHGSTRVEDPIQRFSIAQRLAEPIVLASIPPTQLATIVPDPLFSREQLYEAFRHHALGREIPRTASGSRLSLLVQQHQKQQQQRATVSVAASSGVEASGSSSNSSTNNDASGRPTAEPDDNFRDVLVVYRSGIPQVNGRYRWLRPPPPGHQATYIKEGMYKGERTVFGVEPNHVEHPTYWWITATNANGKFQLFGAQARSASVPFDNWESCLPDEDVDEEDVEEDQEDSPEKKSSSSSSPPKKRKRSKSVSKQNLPKAHQHPSIMMVETGLMEDM